MDGYGDPSRWCRRVTSPPSSSVAITACGLAEWMAEVSVRSCSASTMLVENRQTEPSPCSSSVASQPGRSGPAKPGMRVALTARVSCVASITGSALDRAGDQTGGQPALHDQKEDDHRHRDQGGGGHHLPPV